MLTLAEGLLACECPVTWCAVALQAASRACNTSFGAPQPPQLKAVATAATCLPQAQRMTQVRSVVQLLVGLLHPQADERLTASQMAQLDWLNQAAATPLETCPIEF